MLQVFGDYTDHLPPAEEYLTLSFSTSSLPLQKRWRHNGLSADFMAAYFSSFFPGNTGNGVSLKAEVKNAVGFIANELLENAMKYSDKSSPSDTKISLQMHDNTLIFLASHLVDGLTAKKLQAFINTLQGSDPSEMYLQTVEKNAMDDNATESGLGILAMINDYSATLGWKLESRLDSALSVCVTTMVQLPL